MTDTKGGQMHRALTNWITHSACQLPAVCITRHGLLENWKPPDWDLIGSFDVVVGMHLIDLTQLFVHDAPHSIVHEMSSEDRSLRWQRMELTAAAIVTTLRGMHYEGGGGELERLSTHVSTASLIESKHKNLQERPFQMPPT